MPSSLPDQRWQFADVPAETVAAIARTTGLPELLARVLIERGIDTPERASVHLNPESQELPPPEEAFGDLGKSVDFLVEAIECKEKIAICGDYDADGMTSTALLLRALRSLGADIDYAIPSRMRDGYGINTRIVEEFAAAGVGLILTVDNGIAAHEAVRRAVELGLTVIITDHHDLPELLPPADAILNPKLLPLDSPYACLAGVGVAYILAIATAEALQVPPGLRANVLDLFTLGTIADLAPLQGINRQWLRRGLAHLPQSQLPGIQALIASSGVKDKDIKPEDIGFRLGPRINAIGRIGDPQVVIDLLVTDSRGDAELLAARCEATNRQRQQFCAEIESEAIAAIESESTPELQNWREKRAIVVVQPDWHHGVIGIVASRLVERYGIPVFIGTYEGEDRNSIRGSARSIPEFNVFDALQYCDRTLNKYGGHKLNKYGGHKAAGGFSLHARDLNPFATSLSEFAHQCLRPEYLKPLVKIDGHTDFSNLTSGFYACIDGLHPWGIGNEEPIFWTPGVRITSQRIVGSDHLKLGLCDDRGSNINAIAWRWGEYCPLPPVLDLAYKLRENRWQGRVAIELEIVGARLPQRTAVPQATPAAAAQAHFAFRGKSYRCQQRSPAELHIEGEGGGLLSVSKGQRHATLKLAPDKARTIDVSQAPYYQLVKAALAALSNN